MSLHRKKGFICDMDGVIYHGNVLLSGAKDFVRWMENSGKEYLFLTNSSERSPTELQQKLARLGLNVDKSHFYTSALATASYLSAQTPGGSAYVIGEPGLLNALYNAGITMNDIDPDYVVVGETKNYNYSVICKAVELVKRGAKLIGTNPDTIGPAERGLIVPATRALIAPIEMSTGSRAYFLGKPNPLMMRCGLALLNCDEEDIAIIGDRMDTDILAGIETEIDTVLVLSGVTAKEDLVHFPYRPKYIFNGIGDIVPNK